MYSTLSPALQSEADVMKKAETAAMRMHVRAVASSIVSP
jgi:hypothetical protein